MHIIFYDKKIFNYIKILANLNINITNLQVWVTSQYIFFPRCNINLYLFLLIYKYLFFGGGGGDAIIYSEPVNHLTFCC